MAAAAPILLAETLVDLAAEEGVVMSLESAGLILAEAAETGQLVTAIQAAGFSLETATAIGTAADTLIVDAAVAAEATGGTAVGGAVQSTLTRAAARFGFQAAEEAPAFSSAGAAPGEYTGAYASEVAAQRAAMRAAQNSVADMTPTLRSAYAAGAERYAAQAAATTAEAAAFTGTGVAASTAAAAAVGVEAISRVPGASAKNTNTDGKLSHLETRQNGTE